MVAPTEPQLPERLGCLVRTRFQLREADGLRAGADPERRTSRTRDGVTSGWKGEGGVAHVSNRMTVFPRPVGLATSSSAAFSSLKAKRLPMRGRTWCLAMARSMDSKPSRCPTVTPCSRTCRVHDGAQGERWRETGENPDQGDGPSDPDALDGLGQCRLATQLDDGVEAAAVRRDFPRQAGPFRSRMVVDCHIGAEIAHAFQFLIARRNDRDIPP